ncbi:hypothetical protein NMY3_03045 [Candidatus Nitrosocosmicus oleophilus]|uniref:Uncharacterized protein n=1 Tax=Candidatus Nitrosocosmicus oleophilus TaxID=1353260 RepID=A0A654MCN4_9ARCH|nr:FxLYD domain-containing protein [Candidatus Nitrosocosmicus oleophilus]ALI37232.1 hypothetical protein NMY3_03045 [Candidatus Nitrosocosmicus oleophilus]
MSTKFNDKTLTSLIVNVTLTDLAKTWSLSDTDTATVPFNDEEGQEKLSEKFARQVEEELQKQESGADNREIERIESTSQSELDITSATTYFRDDYFRIVGEVHNTGSEDKEFVKVTATIYDEDNEVIGTDTTFTSPSTISSQESAPFEFMIGESDASNLGAINSYKIIASDE